MTIYLTGKRTSCQRQDQDYPDEEKERRKRKIKINKGQTNNIRRQSVNNNNFKQ